MEAKVVRNSFSLLNLDWQKRTFVKLVSWRSTSWLLGDCSWFCFSLSGFSHFVLLFVLRTWPYDQWGIFSLAPNIQGFTCQGAPCSLFGQHKLPRVFCACPVPCRHGLLYLPDEWCTCIWWAAREPVDTSLGDSNTFLYSKGEGTWFPVFWNRCLKTVPLPIPNTLHIS